MSANGQGRKNTRKTECMPSPACSHHRRNDATYRPLGRLLGDDPERPDSISGACSKKWPPRLRRQGRCLAYRCRLPARQRRSCRADSFHLSHIIGNLIDNALRHAGPEANVTVICDADRRGRLRLTVEDNGTVFPPPAPPVFRPGFRSVPTGDNHGIGLAYIRNTARRIGARLRLDSRPGHGAVLY